MVTSVFFLSTTRLDWVDKIRIIMHSNLVVELIVLGKDILQQFPLLPGLQETINLMKVISGNSNGKLKLHYSEASLDYYLFSATVAILLVRRLRWQ